MLRAVLFCAVLLLQGRNDLCQVQRQGVPAPVLWLFDSWPAGAMCSCCSRHKQ